MVDALKRASAKEITAVIPYYGYARQDRKVSPGELRSVRKNHRGFDCSSWLHSSGSDGTSCWANSRIF